MLPEEAGHFVGSLGSLGGMLTFLISIHFELSIDVEKKVEACKDARIQQDESYISFSILTPI